METISITLGTTEIINGEKKMPGDVVSLRPDDPIALKTIAAQTSATPPAEPAVTPPAKVKEA